MKMKKPRSLPLRKCSGCKQMKEKSGLVRVTLNKEGIMQLDPTSKLPGRGAYICPDVSCLKSAQKTKGLERAFKRSVSHEIYEGIAKQLEK